MRKRVLVAALFLCAPHANAQLVTEMTTERIGEAIAVGMDSSEPRLGIGMLYGQPIEGRPGPHVCGSFVTPFARVATEARVAKKNYRPFTSDHIVPAMIEPMVTVLATAIEGREIATVRRVKLVIVAPIFSEDVAAAMRPVSMEAREQTYSNALGAKMVGVSAMATFPISAFSSDNEVRIVYEGDEKECRAPISLKDLR